MISYSFKLTFMFPTNKLNLNYAPQSGCFIISLVAISYYCYSDAQTQQKPPSVNARCRSSIKVGCRYHSHITLKPMIDPV